MTTELEVSSTGNHRHFDEMIVCSSLLGNAAHAYMNSSCQALLTGDLMQDDAALSSILHDYKLPYESHHHHHHHLSNMMHLQNVNVRPLELEGSSTLDYTRHDCINVDNVSSNYYLSAFSEPNTACNNNYYSLHEHEDRMQLHLDFLGGSRDELVDIHEPNIPWATNVPFNDTKPYQPHVHVNSCLVDDIMMNDNTLISCLLTSSHDPQSYNLVDNAQPLSPLDLNHMQTNANSSKYPLNMSQSSPQIGEIQQVLCATSAAPHTGMSVQQALFEDGQFSDGLFVSALFSDGMVGSKEESTDEYIHGSMSNVGSLQSSSLRGQLGDTMNSSPFESGEVHNQIDKEAMRGSPKSDASGSSSCLVDTHFMHQPQYPSNKGAKRALVEGDQEGSPRKRLTGTTSPARSDDVRAQDQQEQTDNAAPANTNITNNIKINKSNIIDNKKIKNSEKKFAPSTSSTSSSNNNNNTAVPSNNKSGARGNKQSTACDPQSVAARHRRERISERLKILQELVPNGSKVDIVTMLEKAINYVKFLQLQVKVLTTDEYWPNSQKLNQPNEMNLLNLFMSKAQNDASSGKKSEKATESISKT